MLTWPAPSLGEERGDVPPLRHTSYSDQAGCRVSHLLPHAALNPSPVGPASMSQPWPRRSVVGAIVILYLSEASWLWHGKGT